MLEGRCHCGQVGWTYRGDPVRATVCNCQVCRQYGVIWVYGRLGETIDISGETVGYMRHDSDGDLTFHHCPNCGAVQSWRPTSPGQETGHRLAVNVRLAVPETVSHIPVRRWDGAGAWDEVPGEGRIVGDYLL